jgi:formylglycine-generating enzyme required for sulfatase activity
MPLLLCALLLAWGGMHLRDKVHDDSLRLQEYEPPPPDMVFVPAGDFWMGSDDPNAEPDEKPLRKVFVPAFYIDRLEVTNRRYKELMADHRYPAGEDDLPVTHVLKRDAEEFCRRAGRRLPSNAEWEKAARGTDGRVYPWGNEFSADRANINRRVDVGSTNALLCHSPFAASRGKLPGGTFPNGASPYGCQDMAGNVWEWVSDVWIDPVSFGQQTGQPRGIIRGGAYSYSPRQARASYQGFEALETTCHDVGFRCAIDAVPKRK